MAKSKVNKPKKYICPTCKGNGFVKVASIMEEDTVHQCWDCDSEGEFYVYEPPMSSDTDADNSDHNIDKFLH